MKLKYYLKLSAVTCGLTLASVATSLATSYFSETFDSNQPFGGGDSSAFTNTGGVLQYNGATAGASNGLFDSGYANLTSTISSTTNGTYYFGGKFTGDGTAAIALGFAYGSYGNTNTMGLVGSNINLGANYSGYTAGTTHTMIGKLTINGAGTDTMELWVDPVMTSAPTSGALQSTSLDITADLVMAYVNGNNGGIASIDDMIISDNWSDVQSMLAPIPEPSTYALIAGLATLGLVAVRRRRKLAA